MATSGAAVIGSGTPELGTLGVGTNAIETLERDDKPAKTLRVDANTNETAESGSNITNETPESGIIAKEPLEGSTYSTKTLGSGTSESKIFGIIFPNEEAVGDLPATEPSLERPTDRANHFGSAVVQDYTGRRFDLVEDKDLGPETLQGNMAGTGCPHEKKSPPPLRPRADRQIDSVNGNNAIATTLNPTENQSQEDISAGCFPAYSTLVTVSTSAFATEHHLNEENDDKAARIKLEPRKKCSDVLQAVEILKTSYKLSDVTIRKNMMTWSCWNIADLVRGPHKETTWWKGRSLSRRMDAKSDELREILMEEVSDDEEFHQEMAELCRKIDRRDRDLLQLLDEILQVAQQNNNYISTAQTDPMEEVLENQTTKTQWSANLTQSAKDPGQQTAPDNENKSAEGLNKPRNPFARMMRTIRRRFSRRNRTRKN